MAGFLPYFVPCELLVCYEEKREEERQIFTEKSKERKGMKDIHTEPRGKQPRICRYNMKEVLIS